MTEFSVFLKALTPEARASLGGTHYQIAHYPFRVGREDRTLDAITNVQDSRRREDSVPNNDLYLVERGNVLCVSREHFLIDRQGDSFIIVDRGSYCGTLVEGESVGEKRHGGWRPLKNNDVIIVGPSESKFVFKFVVAEK